MQSMNHHQLLQLRVLELAMCQMALDLPATSDEKRLVLKERVRTGVEELKHLWRGHSKGASLESRVEFCRWVLGFYALLVFELDPEFVEYVELEIYGCGDSLPGVFPPDAITWLEIEIRRLREDGLLTEARALNLVRGLSRLDREHMGSVAQAVNAISIAEE